MNKMIKGAVAGTAGIALLAGGFSTYATWKAETTIKAGTIATGQLTIDAGDPVWDDLSTAASNDWVVGSDKMVPGDTVRLSQRVDVTAEGKNLSVRLRVTGWNNSIVGLEAGELQVTGLEFGGLPFNPAGMTWGPDELRNLNADDYISVEFHLPETATQTQNASIDLSNVKLEFEQVQVPTRVAD